MTVHDAVRCFSIVLSVYSQCAVSTHVCTHVCTHVHTHVHTHAYTPVHTHFYTQALSQIVDAVLIEVGSELTNFKQESLAIERRAAAIEQLLPRTAVWRKAVWDEIEEVPRNL